MSEQITPTPLYQSAATIILSAMTGLLLALPLAQPSVPGTVLLIAFTAFGGFLGYRRRTNRSFFYIAALSVLVLSSLLFRDLMKDRDESSAPVTTNLTGGQQ